jgi:hypothetical protein
VVITQLLKFYETQISTTAKCKEISKLYKDQNQCWIIFSVCKVLITLIPKDFLTDLTFPPEMITEAAGAAADVVIQHNHISDVNKQALK